MALDAVAGVAAFDTAASAAIKNVAQHDRAQEWRYNGRIDIRRP